jgi:hypothetical protein
MPNDAPDIINHPAHYTHSAIEPIDVIEEWGLGFHLGQVIKYLARAGRKGPRLEDLLKAQFYLNRAVDNERALAEVSDVE